MAVVAGLACDALRGGRRYFEADARRCVELLHPPLEVLGAQHVPQSGPCVITPNHYYRRGYASQWTALAISAVTRRRVHWIMTGELTFPGRWYASIGRPFSRWLLDRIALVYGFTTMPPMPPRPRDVDARAAAVRSLLRYACHTEDPLIGLAPEGGDQPGGRLSLPPAGVGRFCLLLAARGLRFLPVGVYEHQGRLVLNFGESYELCIPDGMRPPGSDRQAAHAVMERIAYLLPAGLRGQFD